MRELHVLYSKVDQLEEALRKTRSFVKKLRMRLASREQVCAGHFTSVSLEVVLADVGTCSRHLTVRDLINFLLPRFPFSSLRSFFGQI